MDALSSFPNSNLAVEVNAAEGLRIRCEPSSIRLEYLLSFVDTDDHFWYAPRFLCASIFLNSYRGNRVPADLVAEDVKRNYESKWWQACRQVSNSEQRAGLPARTHFYSQGNIAVVEEMLRGGGQALVAARDADNRR